MARPMVWLFIFLAGGIIFGRFFDIGFLPHVLLLTVVLAITHHFVYKRKIAFIFPVFTLLGALFVADVVAPKDAELEQVAVREGFVRVEGWVEDISLTRTGRQRVRISTLAVSVAPEHNVREVSMGIMAFLPEGEYVQMGQRIVASGYLHTLETPRNPGGFNQFQFLRSRGVEYQLFAESIIISEEIVLTIGMRVRGLGLRIADVFHHTLPEQMAGVLAAMVVGDRSGIDADIRHLYSSTGMFHILIVSGLHVNILALAFGHVLKLFGVQSVRTRGLINIGFIVIFVIMTGAGVAAVRSGIMGIFLILSTLLGFENDTPTTLSIAAICLLLFQPLFLFDFGFIYSFTMVLGLSILVPALGRALDFLILYVPSAARFTNNWFIKKYFAFNLAATLVYMLINSYMFFEFSPYNLLANLIIMPTVPVVLTLGFVTGLAGLASTAIAQVVAFPIWALLAFYEGVMEFILMLPNAVVLTGRPSFWTLGVFGAGLALFGLIFSRTRKREHGRAVGGQLGGLVAAVLIGISIISVYNVTRPYIHTTFLYVGQGDGMVIHRGRQALVIDGGGVFGREAGENMGVLTMMPYLNYRGIGYATALVTHNHRDHALGVIEMLQAGRVSHLIMAYANSRPGDEMYDLLVRYSQNIPVTYVQSGDVIEFGEMRLYVLFPHANRIFQGENDNSIVLHAVHGGVSMLLTGDIEQAAEAYLVREGLAPTAHILQVAHHGSRTSTTLDFLRAVEPQAAIISAGRNNIFGHPHDTVMSRLRRYTDAYFVTSSRGAVMVRTDGSSMTINTMLP
ncbi:MAG: DNA internalization-related competence protein ComEC/Rec2 [Defluviitaleaceae bacterium]|nr:DNA internalization-related competence protein ComEC/Rec2 [Defluviitaleaceae bacterium]